MNTTKPKTKLTFDDAAHKIIVLIDVLNKSKVRYSMQHVPQDKLFQIVAKQDANKMKYLIPQAVLDEDTHKALIASVVIVYE